nr:NAD-dependent succinate-semialdehyde dehydrogenase [Caulobacter sp. AP07]
MSAWPQALSLSRPDLLRAQALVGGEWRSAAEQFLVLDPADGSTIAAVADCDAAMALAAVEAASAAFVAWRETTAAARAAILRRWFDLVRANAEDLARLVSREQGKPLAEARGEVAYGAGYLEWFAEEARRAYGDLIPSPVRGRELKVVKEPVGVTAVITPWNFPVAMIARKIAPALAAGCTVVAKPAAETPLSALALCALAQEAGVPPGVINLVPTRRAAEISQVWMDDSRVRKLSFTGSTAVGKTLARQSADTLKRLSLELGGDAPLIVFDDADLEVALDGLMKAKFRNGGQACVAANRIYLQDAIYEPFVARLVDAVAALTVGPAGEGPRDIGPLIHDAAANAMERLVQDALAKGARVLTGGQRHPLGGAFFQPTVLTDVSPDMDLCHQEIFGPIVALGRFSDEDQAVDLANDTPFGLAAYIFSTDARRTHRVAARLDVGIVGINEGAVSTEVAPFGGVKESGYGREGSRYGLADYQNIKYVCVGGLD